MASEHRTFSSRLLTARAGPLLCMTLAGCQALVPEIFEEDDCPAWNDRDLMATFETSEGRISFDRGQILLSTAIDAPECYTGVSLSFTITDESAKCDMNILASGVPDGLGAYWPISSLTFACFETPASIADSYKWDRMSEGGTVRVFRPDNLSSQIEDKCLREGIEIHLNARMIINGVQNNPDSKKEFWFPDQTYFMDDPLPVVEGFFDCPF